MIELQARMKILDDAREGPLPGVYTVVSDKDVC